MTIEGVYRISLIFSDDIRILWKNRVIASDDRGILGNTLVIVSDG